MCFIILIIHPAMSYGQFLFLKQEYSGIEKYFKEINDNFQYFFEETKNSRNPYQLRIERSSRSQMFFKIGVLGVLDLKACKFIKKRLQYMCFLENFYRTPPVAASELILTFWSCINTYFIFAIHISMSLE